MTRTITIAILLIVAAFAASALLYDQLPALVPVHFDAYDHPNGWMHKPWAAVFSPLLMVFMGGVYALARRHMASQRGEEATRGLEVVSLATLALLLEAHVVVLLHACGYAIGISRAILPGIGLLFVVIGNWFGKLPRNYVVGIRTPRTLADDETWLMTHRFAGRAMVLGGLVVFVAALSGAPSILVLALVGAIVALPVLYSYTFKAKGSQ